MRPIDLRDVEPAVARPDAGASALPRRFWLIYTLAWLPYLAIYALIYQLDAARPAGRAIPFALVSVLPPALLGVPMVWLWRRMERSRRQAWTLPAGHVGLALAYGAASAVAINLLFVGYGAIAHFQVYPFHPAIFGWQVFINMLIYALLAAWIHSYGLVSRLRQEEALRAHNESLLARAELRALRAQLNPHFLFNTLHTLLALVRQDQEKAEDALEQFGELLHYALRVQRGPGEEIRLDEEWAFVRNYLALEQLRLGDRLRSEIHLEVGTGECAVPVFSLQPLVENAIRHGIAPRASGGVLSVRSSSHDGTLELSVHDDGPGSQVAMTNMPEGRGMRLVRDRLRGLYGEAAEMTLATPPGGGFIVTLRMPARPIAARTPEAT